MSENETYRQLWMVWPEGLLGNKPAVRLYPGYTLRTYRPGDERRFFEIMDLAGWPGWNEEKLRPWRPRLLPEGWFMAVHAESDQIVATAMALRDMSEFGRPGGELGWLAGDPAHAGKGPGYSVSAAVTGRFMAEGFRDIHLYTEDYRLAALKIYLELGYVPYLYLPEMVDRWQGVCAALDWPFTPSGWRRP